MQADQQIGFAIVRGCRAFVDPHDPIVVSRENDTNTKPAFDESLQPARDIERQLFLLLALALVGHIQLGHDSARAHQIAVARRSEGKIAGICLGPVAPRCVERLAVVGVAIGDAQLIDLGTELALLVQNEYGDGNSRIAKCEAFLYVIDPKTGKVKLAWKE